MQWDRTHNLTVQILLARIPLHYTTDKEYACIDLFANTTRVNRFELTTNFSTASIPSSCALLFSFKVCFNP